MLKKYGSVIALVFIALILVAYNFLLYSGNRIVMKSSRENSNLVLGLSNQAGYPVKMEVYFDGKQCIGKDSDTGGIHRIAYYDFNASTGYHTIKIIANDGTSNRKQVKVGPERKFLIISYWNENTLGLHITIDESDREAGIQ